MAANVPIISRPDIAEIPKISTDIDFAQDGKQMSFLKVPNSTNWSGWGSLLLPITVIQNGPGLTILFTGASHGDEYEGPLALTKLARELGPEQVRGRVIIMPALNYPALIAGTRLSPIDGRNMNRVFPGERDGTITLMIAHYVYHKLLPMADVVVDMHSGGSSMIFAPCVVMHHLENPLLMANTLAAVKTFGTPITLLLRELDNVGMLDTAVEAMGKIFISTELGGGAFVTPETMKLTDTGVHNLLKHFRIIEGEIDYPQHRGLPPTRVMEVPETNGYIMALADGLYEPMVEVGEPVLPGMILGRVHFLDNLDHEPLNILAKRSGVLITRAGRGWVRRGDTVAVIAMDYWG
jgi:N-alpha-acetyl-L-2,4-diaminobutyrate deacetylase